MKCLIITSFGVEGYGHLSRCIAISQALDYLKVKNFFLLNKKNKLIKKKIIYCFNWYKYKKKTLNIIKNFDFIILDSIKINKKYLIQMKTLTKVFYINDFHRWIINDITHIDWTLFAKKKINKSELISFKFTALRKPFWKNQKKIIKKQIENILIFFGGSDIRGFSKKIAKLIINKFKNFKINVISPYKINLKDITYHHFVNENKMKLLLENSDVVITSGGQTLYEMAAIGTPGIVISETKFDMEDTVSWKKKKSIIYAGKWSSKNIKKKILSSIEKIKSQSLRKNLSRNGQNTIDGKGALRLTSKIIKNVKKNF